MLYLCVEGCTVGGGNTLSKPILNSNKSTEKHVRNDPFQKWTTQFQTWIRIDLDQPRLEILIYHKIQTEYLEIGLQTIWIQEQIC